jgi:hypothetical protein
MLEPKRSESRSLPEQHRLTFGNRILDALPFTDVERLVPFLRRVFLQRDQVVVKPSEPMPYLHFPIDAFAWSWMETTGTERPTSVLTVGHRGVLEWNRVLRSECGDCCVSILSPGTVWRLPAEIFEQFQSQPQSSLRRLLLRYAKASLLNAACRLACNSEHNIDQRLAGWLLWMADESARPEFSITHQQIAEIAAIRRPSVSLALSQFQRESFIRSQHGRLRIIDRSGLEAIVCRCYWIINQNSESVFENEDGT